MIRHASRIRSRDLEKYPLWVDAFRGEIWAEHYLASLNSFECYDKGARYVRVRYYLNNGFVHIGYACLDNGYPMSKHEFFVVNDNGNFCFWRGLLFENTMQRIRPHIEFLKDDAFPIRYRSDSNGEIEEVSGVIDGFYGVEENSGEVIRFYP